MHHVISGFLLLWSLAYLWLVSHTLFGDQATKLQRLVAEGRIEAAYADYILSIPLWVVMVSVVLALLRCAGSVSLLLRSSMAVPLWGAALALTLVIFIRGFVFSNVVSVIRPSQVAVEIAFFLISVLALVYALRLRALLAS